MDPKLYVITGGPGAGKTTVMLERSINSYREHASAMVTFSDRGIPDTLCYARL